MAAWLRSSAKVKPNRGSLFPLCLIAAGWGRGYGGGGRGGLSPAVGPTERPPGSTLCSIYMQKTFTAVKQRLGTRLRSPRRAKHVGLRAFICPALKIINWTGDNMRLFLENLGQGSFHCMSPCVRVCALQCINHVRRRGFTLREREKKRKYCAFARL